MTPSIVILNEVKDLLWGILRLRSEWQEKSAQNDKKKLPWMTKEKHPRMYNLSFDFWFLIFNLRRLS